MTQEYLARKFKPAGFDQPEGSRHQYTKPRPELQEAFYQWVSEFPEFLIDISDIEKEYKKAKRLICKLGEIPYKEANGLLVDFKPDEEKLDCMAGLFISACYTHSPEEVVIFDVDAPEIWYIGYRFGENRILVNRGIVNNRFGEKSSGLVLNNMEAGDHFCSESSGVVLNNRKTDSLLGSSSRGIIINNGKSGIDFGFSAHGILIAVKRPGDYGEANHARILRPADVKRNPKLKKYLEELSEVSRKIKDEDSAKEFLEMYGSGGVLIESDIEELVGREL